MNNIFKSALLFLSVALLGFGITATVDANHSWAGYHWARTANPFTLKLGDNVSSAWDSYLATVSSQWSQSSVLDTTVVAGSTTQKHCRGVAGTVQVCNSRYGNNGWLGIAQIWISGSHITQGITKLNDTYFNTATYNTPGWKSLVICQEVGHTFGLDHQDENFNNTPITPHTCMDYFVPGTSEIVGPNAHDFEQLATIYAHVDSTTTVAASASSLRTAKPSENDLENPSEWGKSVKKNAHGKDNMFVKNLGGDKKVITHVFWAE